MKQELKLQANYLQDAQIETIYFGGGTPSILTPSEIKQLIEELAHYYRISPTPEITLEANPDDLDTKKVTELRNTPINRFSIGIQSFFDEDLKWMNRAHTAQEATASIKRVQDAGFENITADLIYGFPLLSQEKWISNISQLLTFHIPHISAYSLTVEPRTALAHAIHTGKQPHIDDEQSAQQFLWLIDMMREAAYEHYEISNFALPHHYAQHNTNYWKAIPYLGIGPSAHSYNGFERQWNVSNNNQYMKAIFSQHIPAEMESLSLTDRLNEYIMTALRTMWGIDLNFIGQTFGYPCLRDLLKRAEIFKTHHQLIEEDTHLKLTTTGKLIADTIAAALFEENVYAIADKYEKESQHPH
ncbi:radical SAM family heme chaperone HemW [Olivibacter ginsenosidimutans]|uniref:Heme chaperone HemW n=2 Tax=Olivibacter ginsenosidimutans TaxID=1176537 RepID=A0ABP9C627_9SPHI